MSEELENTNDPAEMLKKKMQTQRLNEARIKRLYRNLTELQFVVTNLTPIINSELITDTYREELNNQISESLDISRKLLKILPGDGLVQ
ncbi:MAG: hypothetical protein ACOH2A_11865 [Sphingobacteriaceae bacterium]